MKELLERLRAVDQKIDALLEQDSLTDSQKTDLAALEAERATVVRAIDNEKTKQARALERQRLEREATDAAQRAELEQARAEVAAQEAATRAAEHERLAREAAERETERQRRLTTPPVPGENRLTSNVATPVQAVTQGWTVPATVLRHTPQNFRGVRNGRSAEERAFRFGMYMLAKASADMPGRFRFETATNWVRQNVVAMTENAADGSGAFNLVPEEFGQDLIELRETYGVARRLFRRMPMASDTRTDPRRRSGLTAYFTSEGAAGTESNKSWDNIRLTAKDLMVIGRFTNQLRMDSVISLGDDLAGEIAYAFMEKEDQCAFNGTGTSTYGGIVGLRTKLQDVDGSGTDSAGLVTGTGNLFTELTLADFNQVVGKLPQYADMGEVCWVCHKFFYHSVMQRLELAAGGTTALEIRSGNRTPRPLFLGYPVEFSQVFPSTDANSQVVATLGNYVKGAAFGDRQQDEISFSEHATVGGESLWERNQIGIRGTERFDINVHDVGDSSTPGPIVGLQSAAA